MRLTKEWGLPRDWVPLQFLPHALVHTEPPATQRLQFGFPTWTLLPVPVSPPVNCDFFYLLVRLSNLGRSSLPCDFISLSDLRAVDFIVCSLFVCC